MRRYDSNLGNAVLERVPTSSVPAMLKPAIKSANSSLLELTCSTRDWWDCSPVEFFRSKELPLPLSRTRPTDVVSF
jgi:hypothetical protein